MNGSPAEDQRDQQSETERLRTVEHRNLSSKVTNHLSLNRGVSECDNSSQRLSCGIACVLIELAAKEEGTGEVLLSSVEKEKSR